MKSCRIGVTWDPQSMKWSKSYTRSSVMSFTGPHCNWEGSSSFVAGSILIHKLDCIDFNDYLNFTRASCTRSQTSLCFVDRHIGTPFFVNCSFLWNELPHVANASSFQSFNWEISCINVFSLFFMFCFAGFLVVVLIVVNAQVAVICRGNTYMGLPFVWQIYIILSDSDSRNLVVFSVHV